MDEEGQKDPIPKICHTYSTKIKLGTESRDETLLHSTDISIVLSEISKLCYIRKYRHRFHFGTFLSH